MNNVNVPNPVLNALREMARKDADPEVKKKFLELKRQRSGEANKPVVTTVEGVPRK